METPTPVKRPRGRPRKNPLPVVPEVAAVEEKPKPQIVILDEPAEDMPPLEEAPVSEPEPEPALNPLPYEPPLRWPNHLSSVELRSEITRYSDIVGGRMKQLVDELNRRFPFQR